MKKIFLWYIGVPLIFRIIVCFVGGAAMGGGLWLASSVTGNPVATNVIPYVAPFGTIFVQMLKMIVVPVIFFSLVVGAASLPIRQFGRVGVKTMSWYLLTSLLAAVVGVVLALAIPAGAGGQLDAWKQMGAALGGEAENLAVQASTSGGSFTQVIYDMFNNPFHALANGHFLPIIVFSILFGLALRTAMEACKEDQEKARFQLMLDGLSACQDTMFKLVDWILEYSPIGVLALSIMNFGLYGPAIVGPYVRVVFGVVLGIAVLILVVYPVLLRVITGKSPLKTFKHIEEAMVMAFVTRSSAATLPVSMKVATEELGVREELTSFSLPLGATINMDGVCVHLPMFAVLAANMFGLEITVTGLITLVLTTVLASIGAGGVPGGSLMLLFIILGTMGLSGDQVAVVVALALGINPILDMFETMNNVTGDLICTYAVACTEGLVEDQPEGSES